jgi:hypothetical protein
VIEILSLEHFILSYNYELCSLIHNIKYLFIV